MDIDDALSREHRNAIWILNAAGKESLPATLKRLIDKEDWWGDLDENFRFYRENYEYEEPEFEGILYTLYVTEMEEPIILSYKETLYYLKIIAERYIKWHPESKKQIEELMQQYKDTYHL